MSRCFFTPRIDVLVKRQENQCVGSVEVWVLKKGYEPVIQPVTRIGNTSIMSIAVITLIPSTSNNLK